MNSTDNLHQLEIKLSLQQIEMHEEAMKSLRDVADDSCIETVEQAFKTGRATWHRYERDGALGLRPTDSASMETAMVVYPQDDDFETGDAFWDL